ncbi:hypothetical protein GCM10011583_58080 [Streptomyces camponoticapitis]|uniref:Uncharacterized protein n=1 Tax=Streptomyces camponoticapitis TaxID=1616125 RepID=A0ABQ2ERF5_9ACTN|nr:hypothetical protein GCM10011583_58080 [Streptomyces camponoticapitis]
MTPTDHGVRKSWDRIDAWFKDRLHRTPVRAAAEQGRLRAIEADLGAALPTEVRDWWTLDRVSAFYGAVPVGPRDVGTRSAAVGVR